MKSNEMTEAVVVKTIGGEYVGAFPTYTDAFAYLHRPGWCANRSVDVLRPDLSPYLYLAEEGPSPSPRRQFIVSQSPEGRLKVSDSWETFLSSWPGFSGAEEAIETLPALGWTIVVVQAPGDYPSQSWMEVHQRGGRLVGAYASDADRKRVSGLVIDGRGCRKERVIVSGPPFGDEEVVLDGEWHRFVVFVTTLR